MWSNADTDLATARAFSQNPQATWNHYLQRFATLADARPNPAHHALTAILAARPHARLITQNIDRLHEAAGTDRVLHAHGVFDRARCTAPTCPLGGRDGSLPTPDAPDAPCPRCGAPLRPHVLWFDESYASHQDYAIDTVESWSDDADQLWLIGTSCAVGLTDLLIHRARVRALPILFLDPAPPPHLPATTYRTWPDLQERPLPPADLHHLPLLAESALPALLQRLP